MYVGNQQADGGDGRGAFEGRQGERSDDLFVENVSPEMKDWLLKVLEGGQGSPKYGKEGMLVMRLAASIRTAWEKTMAIDRHMNKRLAGADSFYADKQNQVM